MIQIIKDTVDAQKIVFSLRNGVAKPSSRDFHIRQVVTEVIEDVRQRGDEALLESSRKFDKSTFQSPEELVVNKEEIEKAKRYLTKAQENALSRTKKRIEIVARKQLSRFKHCIRINLSGSTIKERYLPVESVGCYVPGGLASYPSTVLMTVVPARVCGVDRISIATPPNEFGKINPVTLVAASLCNVEKIYKIGGAQAIAAFAYGTQTIPAVSMIVGPGNEYVTFAKILVSSKVKIDMPAGPTELLIIADEKGDPEVVADDLISQAEHGNKTLCGLVTTSENLAYEVEQIVKNEISHRERKDILQKSKIFYIIVKNTPLAIRFAQLFAPEHLELMVDNASSMSQLVNNVKNAGLILCGESTPCAATDYSVGTNHVLPTGGSARAYSGLSVENYLKRVTTVRCSRRSLFSMAQDVQELAKCEGLPNHAIAIQRRVSKF
jgi:histidinol dehydrogenase